MRTSHADQEGRFLFRGSAFAIGGYMTRPYSEIIETQASSVLPMVGGGCEANVEDYNYRDLVSFSSAHSKVLGNVDVTPDGRRIYNTLATVTVENLNIADLITADRVVARLVSEKEAGQPELPMLPVGSYISNLQIAGFSVDLPPLLPIFEAPTSKEMSRALTGKGMSFRDFEEKLELFQLSEKKETSSGHHFDDHRVLTSVYGRPKRLPPGCLQGHTTGDRKLYPWGIHIGGFGSVYFGEMFISRDSRRLSMIRLDLGSPEEGEILIVSTTGNGTTYP